MLEQGDRSLEDHMRDFLDLASLTHYLDCSLFQTSLNEWSNACLPVNGPWGNFAAFMQWVLANKGSFFTISIMDKANASPTPDPEPSQAPQG